MVDKINLSQLSWRAFEGALSGEELSAYFLADEAKSRPLAPAVRLNPALVDSEGRRLTARSVNQLRTEAESALLWRSRPSARRGETKVLAEGDSWFNLPNLIFFGYPPDAIDVLAKTHDVWRVAMWSDEMAEMVSPSKKVNYLQPLGSGNFSHFVFSGGGNDVLGRIDRYVMRLGSPGTDPSRASSYLGDAFTRKVDEIIGLFGTLHADVQRVSPKTMLYVHGYANAVPKSGGKFIGRRLERLGFDVGSGLARGIVAEMVTIFNDALSRFAGSRRGVAYLDLRPLLGPADWHSDEIHPNRAGARKIAAAMGERIAENIPVA